MFLQKIKERANSDKAAIGTTETILLIALAVFGTLAVFEFIIKPIQKSSEGIGKTIEGMNPNTE